MEDDDNIVVQGDVGETAQEEKQSKKQDEEKEVPTIAKLNTEIVGAKLQT